MKTMLILTDFSEAAFRAAEYGCELAGCLGIKRIVLYNAFQPAMAFASTNEMVGISNNGQEFYLESMEALGLLQDRLKPMLPKEITIDLVAEDIALAGLADMVNERSQKEGIDIAVMGVSGKSGLDKFLLGSTTTQILRDGQLPVLIVPEETPLGKAIETIVLTTDLKESSTLPVKNLYEFLDALSGKLQVINVQPKEREKYSVEMEKAITDLHKLLDKYDPGFNYINGNDVVEEVLAFAGRQHALLIIAVHHEHGFLSNLFHKSVTKKLAYNSNVPLLSLPALKGKE